LHPDVEVAFLYSNLREILYSSGAFENSSAMEQLLDLNQQAREIVALGIRYHSGDDVLVGIPFAAFDICDYQGCHASATIFIDFQILCYAKMIKYYLRISLGQ